MASFLRVRTLRTITAAVLLVSALAASGCARNDIKPDLTTKVTPIEQRKANAKVQLTIGAKDFTEQKVLGELYAQALAAAGYRVKTKLDLANEDVAFDALKTGQISGYPEYTGTALLSFFDVESGDMPASQQDAFAQAKKDFAQEGIVALDPTPFSSSNAVAMTAAKHDELGYDRLDELAGKSAGLVFSGPPECRYRHDCLLGLKERYGIKFKEFLAVPASERFDALTSGRADLGIVFTTDPQIESDHLVVLDDPDGMFPPGNATFLTKQQTIEKAGPDFAKTIDAVTRRLTTPTIRRLNAQVDLKGETPEQAAHEYLVREGYIR
jgi:osmoprotectant transport system substrate-binding protein